MRALSWGAFLAASAHAPVGAQVLADDPYAYDVRVGLFPVAFVAGISQSQFGAAGRAELDLGRRVTLQVAGRGGVIGVAGETSRLGFGARLTCGIHLVDERVEERLGGTVYPEDTPAAGASRRTTDTDLHVPMSQKLGGPRLTLPEKARDLVAPMRRVHTLRLGADYTRSMQLARPGGGVLGSALPGEDTRVDQVHVLNTAGSVFIGYAWGTHYNLSARTAGATEVGFRRYFVDALLTLEDLSKTEAIGAEPVAKPRFFPAGVRIGMEGTLGALIDGAPGVGFGYSLELGALPGASGVEGYLLVGLGVALDFASAGATAAR